MLVPLVLLFLSVPTFAEPQPGIQIALRQNLFDWGTSECLELLKQKLATLKIPDVEKVFSFPIVGEFKLQLSNLHVAAFNASSEDARLKIMDDHFALNVDQIEADISFKWHWEKLGMSGTGQGELLLHGGSIALNFTVTDTPTPAHSFRQGSLEEAAEQQAPIQHPQITVVGSTVVFDSVELAIKSYAADWLYQAVLSLFNDKIQRAVINGINGALQKDVPSRINDILDTLPTHVEIKGLPLTASFQVALYTSTYVMVQGYGDIESDVGSAVRAAAVQRATHAPFAQARRLRGSSTSAPGVNAADLSASTHPRELPTSAAATAAARSSVADTERCPYEASTLPLGPPEIGSDPHMTSLYLHQSIINCVAWGLFRGEALKVSIMEGTIPNLHITTDLLAMLIPELPRKYPRQYMRIDVTALAAPLVTFSAAPAGTGTTTLVASYRTAIYVANDTLGNPHIATLSANLTVAGQLAWDATIVSSAHVSHLVESASMMVPAPQWDQTVAWFIENYAGLFPLQSLVNKYVNTPVTSLVALINSQTTAYDEWVALSGDVILRQQ